MRQSFSSDEIRPFSRISLIKNKDPDFEKSGLYCKIMVCKPHYIYSPIIRHIEAIIKSNF
ncbi:hypothetical protein GCWU000341_01500, partial [Oribacterium sp. oral taxon 078 str. F0262]